MAFLTAAFSEAARKAVVPQSFPLDNQAKQPNLGFFPSINTVDFWYYPDQCLQLAPSASPRVFQSALNSFPPHTTTNHPLCWPRTTGFLPHHLHLGKAGVNNTWVLEFPKQQWFRRSSCCCKGNWRVLNLGHRDFSHVISRFHSPLSSISKGQGHTVCIINISLCLGFLYSTYMWVFMLHFRDDPMCLLMNTASVISQGLCLHSQNIYPNFHMKNRWAWIIYCFNSWVKLKKLKHNTAKQTNTVISQLSDDDDDGEEKTGPLSRSIDILIYPRRT